MELISREALIEKLEEYIEYDTFDLYKEEPLISLGFEQLEDIICSQPTVEAKEVVRCKDCKHSDLPAVLTRKYGKIGTLTCHNRYSPCNNRNVNEKDFCSYGEMRTSAE